MGFLREYHYSHAYQRKIIDYINFLSFLLIGIFFVNIAIVSKYYFYYELDIQVILILCMAGVFAGAALGRLLYTKFKNHRSTYIFSELAYLSLVLAYFLLDVLKYDSIGLVIHIFFFFKYIIPAVMFIVTAMIGLKVSYSIRISCAEFTDSEHGAGRFIGFMLLGILLGVAAAELFYSYNIPVYFFGIVPVLIVPSIFLVNFSGYPVPVYENDEEEEKEEEPQPEKNGRTDKLIFIYLNFLYIIMYAYLGFASISRYYGDFIHVKLLFVVILFLFMLAGYIAGRYIPLSNLYTYGELFFPAAFLVFLILLIRFSSFLHFFPGILLFLPVALVMGIVLSNTVRDIIDHYDNKVKSRVIEFAIIILPSPILIALSFINFTNFWYFIVIGIIMILNVIIPSIYTASSAIAGYRKAVFFFFSLIFLPLFIFIIIFFNIPLDSNVYVTKVGNFEELRDLNYNADYIKNQAVVMMNNSRVFHLSDSMIRNYKRSLVPLSLYHPENKQIIFIDGNQKFFRNPVIGYFDNSICLDIVTERDVDFNRLPLSGSQKYVPEYDDPLTYFERSNKKFFTIVDIPNLLDQNNNSFRFSMEYYGVIKRQMENKGVFVQIFNIPDCRKEIFTHAVLNMRGSFTKHIVFFFSDMLVIMSSDDAHAFDVKQEQFIRLIKFLTTHEELSDLFLNESHVLSHLQFTKIDDFLPFMPDGALMPARFLISPHPLEFKAQFFSDFSGNNRRIFNLIDKSFDQRFLLQIVNNQFQYDESILTLLKKTELAESRENYKDETSLLFELKKQAEYRITLQQYIFKMLKYKEKYYYNQALRLERNKKWEDAKELYKAVLLINNDNFDANYRMGLLCITVQDIDGSFKYLQQAMRINKNHPKVLFQMGILFFSIGKFNDAVEYFNRALQQNEKSSSIYRYLGLCYQNLGNLIEAEKYFSKALLTDPNDLDIKSRLDEVRSQIQKENKKWDMPEQKNESDVEQDADMPLPVSKGAYDIRLNDNDNSLPVLDPQTGEKIQDAVGKKSPR
jgi:tetratricopeptide (TPR) repeat protein